MNVQVLHLVFFRVVDVLFCHNESSCFFATEVSLTHVFDTDFRPPSLILDVVLVLKVECIHKMQSNVECFTTMLWQPSLCVNAFPIFGSIYRILSSFHARKLIIHTISPA